jgi:hypothetical protein
MMGSPASHSVGTHALKFLSGDAVASLIDGCPAQRDDIGIRHPFNEYARACGAILARAYAPTGEARQDCGLLRQVRGVRCGVGRFCQRLRRSDRKRPCPVGESDQSGESSRHRRGTAPSDLPTKRAAGSGRFPKARRWRSSTQSLALLITLSELREGDGYSKVNTPFGGDRRIFVVSHLLHRNIKVRGR